MKRPIKFRGQLPTGKFVFGDLVQWGGFEEPRICSWDNGVIYDIEPDSVAQLVGFDCDGNEVYEGDLLRMHKGSVYPAHLISNIIAKAKLKEVVNETDD